LVDYLSLQQIAPAGGMNLLLLLTLATAIVKDAVAAASRARLRSDSRGDRAARRKDWLVVVTGWIVGSVLILIGSGWTPGLTLLLVLLIYFAAGTCLALALKEWHSGPTFRLFLLGAGFLLLGLIVGPVFAGGNSGRNDRNPKNSSLEYAVSITGTRRVLLLTNERVFTVDLRRPNVIITQTWDTLLRIHDPDDAPDDDD
ncbi:MAG TPA: hypothetical protein VML96_13275, partial [Egibacteraceae bacterium]|nr:hypothetical protein [Egibacteraceae bacterium]